MRTNHLRTAAREGRTAWTAWVSLDSRYAAEVLSHAGFDAVTVDLQHGMFGIGEAIDLLRAVSTGPAVPLARCSSLDPPQIGKLLDAGAYGIICPAIDSAEECERFVRACRYPPRGTRSFGPARGLLYGGPDYVAHADDTVMAWAMVESTAALAQIDAIVAVPELDGIYIGPNDLAISMGEEAGAPTSPVRQVIEECTERAHTAGRRVGAFAPDLPTARWMADIGIDMVTPGNDVMLLKEAARTRLGALRGASGGGDG